MFNSLETWFFAQVQTEVVIFDKEYFDRIFKHDVMTKDLMMQKALLGA